VTAVTAETAATKAARYLAEGRLVVTLVDADLIVASCRGDGEIHQLGHEPGRGWWCTCPARGYQCAHLRGLRLVVVRRDPEAARRRVISAAAPGPNV
jgi:hypothetical protein